MSIGQRNKIKGKEKMVRKIVPIAVIVAFVSSAVALIVEASYAIAYKSNFYSGYESHVQKAWAYEDKYAEEQDIKYLDLYTAELKKGTIFLSQIAGAKITMYGSRGVINNTKPGQNNLLVNGMLSTIQRLRDDLLEDAAKDANIAQIQLDMTAIHDATKKHGSDGVYAPWWLSIKHATSYFWCLILSACIFPASLIYLIVSDD